MHIINLLEVGLPFSPKNWWFMFGLGKLDLCWLEVKGSYDALAPKLNWAWLNWVVWLEWGGGGIMGEAPYCWPPPDTHWPPVCCWGCKGLCLVDPPLAAPQGLTWPPVPGLDPGVFEPQPPSIGDVWEGLFWPVELFCAELFWLVEFVTLGWLEVAWNGKMKILRNFWKIFGKKNACGLRNSNL